MNENDLIIDIGADLSSFNSSMEQAKKSFRNVQKVIRNLSKNQTFIASVTQTAKQLDKNEKEYAKFAKKIKKHNKDISDDYIKQAYNAHKTSLANAKKLAKDEKAARAKVIKEIEALNRKADKRKTTANLEKQLEYEKRRLKVLHARDLSNLKRRNARRRALSAKFHAEEEAQIRREAKLEERLMRKNRALAIRASAGVTTTRTKEPRNPWGNIESVGHAARTTALYGAMAQALFGLQNAFRSTVEEAFRFDQSIQQNIAVLALERDEAVYLARTVTEIGRTFGTEFNEIQEGLITLGRAGVDNVEQLKKGTEGLAALSIVTGDAMHYGAAAVASLVAVYPELNDNMVGLTNNMAAVANATRLGLEDFSTISNYALTTAKSIGLSSKAYLGLAGALSKVGLNASTIGTSIRRLDKFTLDSAKSVQNFFRIAGQSQEDFAKSLRDSKDGGIQAMADFTNRLARMSEEQFAAAVGDLNIQLRATAKALRAVGELGEFEAMIAEMEKGRDVTEQAKKAALGLDAAWGRIKNTLKTVFSEEIQKIMKDLFSTDNAAEFLRTLATIKNAVLTVVTGIKLGFNAVDLAIESTVLLIGTGINLVYEGWERLGVGLYNVIVDNLKLIGEYYTKFINWLLDQVNNFVNAVGGIVSTIAEKIGLDFNIKPLKLQIDDFTAGMTHAKESGEELINLDFTRTKLNETIDDLNANVDTLIKGSVEYENTLKRIDEVERKRKALGPAPEVLGHDYKADAEAIAELQRKAEILNGTWTKEKEIKSKIKTITSEIARLSAEEQDASKFVDNTTEILELQNDLMDEQINLQKEHQRLAEKGGKGAERAARIADKMAKDLMKQNEEISKQELLRYKISVLRGKEGFSLKSKSLRAYVKEAKIAKDLVEKNKLLVKGTRSAVQLEKDKTASLQAEYDLLVKMTEEMNKWENVFDDIFSGDFLGAFNTAFEDTITDIKSSIAELVGGADTLIGSIFGGLTGSLITTGLGALFDSFAMPEFSQEDWDKVNLTVNDPESESIVNLLESMDWSLTRDLTYSKGIYDNLSSLVEQSGKAAIGLTSTFDFSGISEQSIGGFAGFSTESVQTLFSGLTLQLEDIRTLAAYTTETIRTESSSWWGLVNEWQEQTINTALDSKTAQALAEAYGSGIQAVVDGAEALGIEGAYALLGSFEGAIHKLDFEGKSQEEIAAMIEGAISSDLDAMVEQLVPWLSNFQKVGEDYFETMGRVAYEIEVVDMLFTQLGHSLERTGYVAAFVSDAFIEASGGLDNALSNVNGYIDNFYTDAEKQALRVEQLRSTGIFADVDAYKAEVDKFTALSAQGNATASEHLADLLRMQDIYKDYFDYLAEIPEKILTTLNDAELYTQLMSNITGLTAREIALTGDDTAQAEYAVTASLMMLDAIKAQTELYDVTMDNYFDQLEAAHLANELTAEQLSNWEMLGDALLNVEEASKALEDMLSGDLQEAIKAIGDAWLSNLSYLNIEQKTLYAEGLAQFAQDNPEALSPVDASRLAAEQALKSTATMEEYIPYFDKYIAELEKEVPEEDKQYVALLEILEQNVRIEEAITNSSYQSALSPIEVTIVP